MGLVLRYRGFGGGCTVPFTNGGFISKNPPEILVADMKLVEQHIRNSAGTANLQPSTSRVARRKEPPFSLVEISLSAQNLLDRDVLSKSDPSCIIYVRDGKSSKPWLEVGRTERVINSLNPIWNAKFVLKYRFQTKQVLKFEIYDWDDKTSDLEAHDYLGCVKCSLAEIVTAPSQKFVQDLVLPVGFRGKSTLTIIADELSLDDMTILRFRISCRNLETKKFFGQNNPFLMISKRIADGSWVLIHKTEIIKQSANPIWRFFTVRITALKSGDDYEVPLKFKVMDWGRSGLTELIGSFNTTYVELAKRVAEDKATFELINELKQQKKKSYKNSGLLTIHCMNIDQERSFMDHLKNGLKLHCTFAIDFSLANGRKDSIHSLHYCRKTDGFGLDHLNRYTIAIETVGEILQDYSHEKKFPVFGYGAIVPPSMFTSQDFPLNGNAKDPYCNGVEGILEAYHRTLETVEFSYPSKMSTIVKQVASLAKTQTDGKHYHVLVVITRGQDSDLEGCKESIIKASNLPMSVIIIGIGDSTFAGMEALDGDGHLLQTYGGLKAARDIVQFVELRQYMPKLSKLTNEQKANFSSGVLAELPEQVCSWMKQFKPEPLPPSSPTSSTSAYSLPTR